MAPSLPQILIILLIVVLLFGTKKLRNLGSDLGGALKGFKNAVKDDEDETGQDEPSEKKEENKGETIDVTAEKNEE